MSLSLFLLLLLFVSSHAIYPMQHAALMAVYGSAGCRLCRRFSITEMCPDPLRLTCTGDDVTFLDLSEDNLNGTIDTRIGLLTALTTLRFAKNLNLTGTVPAQLANLRALREFNIDQTDLFGALPPIAPLSCSAVGSCVSCSAAPMCNCSRAVPLHCSSMPRVVPGLNATRGVLPGVSRAPAPTTATPAVVDSTTTTATDPAPSSTLLVVPVGSATASGKGADVSALLGGVLGGVLGVALLVGLVLLLVWRARRKRGSAAAGAPHERPPAEAYARPDAPYKNRKYQDVHEVRAPQF